MSGISIEMTEWSEQLLEGDIFKNDRDRKTANQLTESGILEIFELKSGTLVRSNSHVGRISLGEIQLHVKPKLQGLPLLTLLQYAYEIRHMKFFHQAEYSVGNINVSDLLIYSLYVEAEALLNLGLNRTYTHKEEELAYVKGKIHTQRIAARGGIITGTLPCQYYDRNENIRLNQVLFAGLRLAENLTASSYLRQILIRLTERLALLIEPVSLNHSIIEMTKKSITRLTDRYIPALNMITLLYELQSVQLESGTERVFLAGHFFDMNLFFETLVSKLLKTLPQEYKVLDQYRLNHLFAYDSAHNPQRRQSPTPRPDFAMMKNGQPQQLLDAKYRDLWGKSLPRDMLYQLAVYALSGVGNNSATILYPVFNDLPEPQHIHVHNPLSARLKARVYLKPINLIKVAEWIQDKNMSSLANYMEEIIAW